MPLQKVDEEFSARAYLRDSERVVHITFPDKRRKRPLGNGKWHVRLLPMQLFWVEFCAVCVIHAWYDEKQGGLRLAVSDLNLEGVPNELGVSETLLLEVDGQLVPRSSSSSAPVLDGKIQMQLTAPHLPAVLEFAPGFQDVVQSILDSVLERLERSIVREVGKDYRQWVLERRSQSSDSIDQGQEVTLLSGNDGG